MATFFSSDHHCYHTNIMKHCNRPFSSSEEMTDTIIQRHNKVVQPIDTVYWLGDLAWNLHEEQLERLIKRFNGKKHFLLGNHDKAPLFRSLANRRVFESVHDTSGITIGQQYIWLSHYPHRSWNKSFHGAYHLYGHCHGTAAPYGKSFDVGVDAWGFAPVSYDMVVATMDKMPRQNTESNDEGEGRVRTRWSGINFLNGTDK